MSKKIRVLLTGGGSGGHIYALLAVTNALKNKIAESGLVADIRYFGDPLEYKAQLEGEGIRVHHIIASKLRRYLSFLNFIDFFKFLLSIPESLWKIFWFMPDAAFSKGGPGSLPVLIACWFYRIPIVIHDSDAIPGLTSRYSGRFAKIVALAFESAAAYFPKNKTAVTGNPVRTELLLNEGEHSPSAKSNTKFDFKFEENLPLILVLGGSQGAEKINNFILENLEDMLDQYQILHQVGIKNFPVHMENFNVVSKNIPFDIKKRYKVVPFLQKDLKAAFIASDFVISRAGAGAIFEIAASGLPSIIIPLDAAAYNHQNANAIQYEESGACVIIKEENLFGNLVLQEIERILENPEKLHAMQEAAKNFYKPSAAKEIAALILTSAQI